MRSFKTRYKKKKPLIRPKTSKIRLSKSPHKKYKNKYTNKRLMGEKKKVTIEGTEYTPEQISAMILQKLYTFVFVKDCLIIIRNNPDLILMTRSVVFFINLYSTTSF